MKKILGTAGKYLDYLFRARFSKRLSYLIFFVTSRCHSNCRLCFNRANLNKNDDLTYSEIKHVIETSDPLTALLLSGGEPFLREELADIVTDFIRICGVRLIAIPTNGFDPVRIENVVRDMLRRNPGTHISVNPSLDGPVTLNDTLRFNGSYRLARETILRLVRLKKEFHSLEVVVNTVVTASNASLLPAFMDEVADWGVTGHNFELVRNPEALPSIDEIRSLHKTILKNRRRYLLGTMERMSIIGTLALAQNIKENSLAGGSFRCVAGRSIGVLDANGGIRACELLPPVGNVRDFDCDFSLAWKTLSPMAPDRCSGCTHICFINASIASDPVTILKIPFAYMRCKN